MCMAQTLFPSPTSALGQELALVVWFLRQHRWVVDVSLVEGGVARVSAHREASPATFSDGRALKDVE